MAQLPSPPNSQQGSCGFMEEISSLKDKSLHLFRETGYAAKNRPV
jgi:hypothetical protein